MLTSLPSVTKAMEPHSNRLKGVRFFVYKSKFEKISEYARPPEGFNWSFKVWAEHLIHIFMQFTWNCLAYYISFHKFQLENKTLTRRLEFRCSPKIKLPWNWKHWDETFESIYFFLFLSPLKFLWKIFIALPYENCL